MDTKVSPDIHTIRDMVKRYSNWNRWGAEDECGTLNFVTPAAIVDAARLVKRGMVFSLSIPVDEKGPMPGGSRRYNPMHFMTRDGANAVAGTTTRDEYRGVEPYTLGNDDSILMGTHSTTHWDALGHINFEGKIYNGYSSLEVSMRGARKGAIDRVRDKIVGRGVLLDMARAAGKRWLEAGTAIGAEQLQACADRQKVDIRAGDFLLIRTGQMAQVQERGSWGDYAGGNAPGLGLGSVAWLHAKYVAGVATDTGGAEVRPNETAGVFQPLHILLVNTLGLTVGEIFYLEELADDCAKDGVYEFFFVASPLRITGGCGSPVNPTAVK